MEPPVHVSVALISLITAQHAPGEKNDSAETVITPRVGFCLHDFPFFEVLPCAGSPAASQEVAVGTNWGVDGLTLGSSSVSLRKDQNIRVSVCSLKV